LCPGLELDPPTGRGRLIVNPTTDKGNADFSGFDSLNKVHTAFAAGMLEKLHLLPIEYGGKDIAENTVYVPLGVGVAKRQIDETVAKLFRTGAVTKYSARPEYSGSSFVPKRIVVKAWHTEKDAAFEPVIEIW
jgi:hypothetical protein